MAARRPAHDRLSLAHLQAILSYHEALLRDRPRNAVFARALERAIRPGACVLDVGSGSGLWAVLAARLGARRVVAVEREPLLRPVIERLIAENGVGDRVELISRDFKHVRLPREFDVIVSETVGSMAFEEDILPIMRRSRDLFLRPGGVLVPDRIVFQAAPLHLRRALPDPPALLPGTRSLRELVAQMPRPLHYLEEYDLLADPVGLDDVDLHQTRANRSELGRVSASWRLERADRLDGIAVWLRLRVGPNLWVETRGSGAWSARLFPVEPFSARRGRLHLELESLRLSERWKVALEAGRVREEREYCPAFAYGSIRAALRRSRSRDARRRRGARP